MNTARTYVCMHMCCMYIHTYVCVVYVHITHPHVYATYVRMCMMQFIMQYYIDRDDDVG